LKLKEKRKPEEPLIRKLTGKGGSDLYQERYEKTGRRTATWNTGRKRKKKRERQARNPISVRLFGKWGAILQGDGPSGEGRGRRGVLSVDYAFGNSTLGGEKGSYWLNPSNEDKFRSGK